MNTAEPAASVRLRAVARILLVSLALHPFLSRNKLTCERGHSKINTLTGIFLRLLYGSRGGEAFHWGRDDDQLTLLSFPGMGHSAQ